MCRTCRGCSESLTLNPLCGDLWSGGPGVTLLVCLQEADEGQRSRSSQGGGGEEEGAGPVRTQAPHTQAAARRRWEHQQNLHRQNEGTEADVAATVWWLPVPAAAHPAFLSFSSLLLEAAEDPESFILVYYSFFGVIVHFMLKRFFCTSLVVLFPIMPVFVG